MRKFLFLSIVTMGALLSCTHYEPANMGVQRYVIKGKKVGVEEQIDGQWCTKLPVQYDAVKGAFKNAAYLATKGENTYLFSLGLEQLCDGQAVIRIDSAFFKKAQQSAWKYYGKMFSIGNYAKIYTKQAVYGVYFDCFDKVLSFGPYQDFVPGCSGFMFKQNGQWCAKLCSVNDHKSPGFTPDGIKQEPEPFVSECSQLIEVRKLISYGMPDKAVITWFAKKGDQWYSFDAAGKSKAVDKTLLKKAESLSIVPELAGEPYKVYPEQRVGSAEASVVFL